MCCSLLEAAGLLRLHRISASFEGAGAERSLAEALARVTSLHAEYGLSATLVCRGGGPVEAFRPLNSYAVARAATADRLPNLIVGVGHAGTPRTALDAVAARSEPTPTAAAMLVRHLVERTGLWAERALAAFDAAIEEDLGAAGRIAWHEPRPLSTRRCRISSPGPKHGCGSSIGPSSRACSWA